MRQRAKLCDNWSTVAEMWRFFKMVAVCHIELVLHVFGHHPQRIHGVFIIVHRLVGIRNVVLKLYKLQCYVSLA